MDFLFPPFSISIMISNSYKYRIPFSSPPSSSLHVSHRLFCFFSRWWTVFFVIFFRLFLVLTLLYSRIHSIPVRCSLCRWFFLHTKIFRWLIYSGFSPSYGEHCFALIRYDTYECMYVCCRVINLEWRIWVCCTMLEGKKFQRILDTIVGGWFVHIVGLTACQIWDCMIQERVMIGG
jgi:hypothetical protein